MDDPVACVDRKVLREFEAVAPVGDDIWPERGVFVATLDFAKRPEVASCLPMRIEILL